MRLLGKYTLARKLPALWGGLVFSLGCFCFMIVFCNKDKFGLNQWDMGGIFQSPATTEPLFGLLSIIAAIQFGAYFVALIAYYANWELMRRVSTTQPPRANSGQRNPVTGSVDDSDLRSVQPISGN